MTYSIIIPHYKILHFKGLRKVGMSRYGKRQIGHFDCLRSPIGTSILNTFGEPIHYKTGTVVGCSRRTRTSMIHHFNSKGTKVGYSRIILGFIILHRIKKPFFYT